jgi:hypothetical protein
MQDILQEKYQQIVEQGGMSDSWTDVIGGKEVTITLPDVLEYLKREPVQELEAQELKPLLVKAVQEPDAEHLKRINKADLNYPIVVVRSKGKYRSILDGNHRLQKAIRTGAQTIKVRVLDLDTAPELYKQMFRS